MSLWSPRERVLRRPDMRGLVVPKLSADPLGSDVDYDDLVIHRAWREYETKGPGEVRYFMYQLSQRDVGSQIYQPFYKAVRFLRVTRVPRYLKQMNASPSGNAQQKKLLAGVREQQVLFVNMIAKSPQMPLVFAYGVQAVGATVEQAQQEADRSYTVLQTLLDGVYQQLEYKPITVEEGELLARYQQQWRSIAMARGRPRRVGADGGVDSYLDGNKTDVENTQNMIDSFIRGMGERSFMLSLITVPVAPTELTLVWRNLAKRLSDVRSEQSGSRAVSAGFALPLGMGTGFTDTQGASHQAGQSQGTGSSDSVGRTDTYGLSEGVSQSYTESQSQTMGTSESYTQAQTVGTNLGVTEGLSAGQTLSENQSVSQSQGVSQGVSEGVNTGLSVSQGASQGVSQGVSESFTQGVSQNQTLGQSVNQGTNWASSVSNQVSGTVSASNSIADSVANSINQGISLSNAMTNSISSALNGSQGQNSANGGGLSLPGIGNLGLTLGQNQQTGASFGQGAGQTLGIGNTLGVGTTLGTSLTNTMGQSISQGVSLGETLGGSNSVGLSASNSVGVNQTAGQSVNQGISQTTSQTVGQSLGQSTSQSLGVNQSAGVSAGVGQSVNVGQNQGTSQGVSQANSVAVGVGANQSETSSVGRTVGQNTTASVSAADSTAQALMANQAYSNAYVSALSRAAQQSTSIGVIPNVGLMLNKNTFDEGKRVIGDLIEAQMMRYLEGIDSGAFFYQMFLVCEDEATLKGASGLLKSAFWGSGDGGRLPQPFHVTDMFDETEKERLLAHAAAFTSYRKRERSMDLVEPYVWSTYMTPSEGAIFTQPPTAEALGLLAVHDSMPVFSMPYDRAGRDIYLGHVINGERARVSNQSYGLDLDELVHTLVAGTTGSGKTTFLRRLLFEAVHAEKDVIDISIENGKSQKRSIPAGALVLDWARSFRGLGAVLPKERFAFYSVAKPELGRFRFNPLALPDDGMNPVEWASTLADLFMVAFGLGEVARSIFYENVAELYAANRLETYTLRPAVYDEDGVLIRDPIELPAVDRATLPESSIVVDAGGVESANVYTCPALSRLVSLEHLAVLVAAAIEHQATREGKAIGGTNMQDRLQTVWRRLIAFAPGGALCEMFAADERLDEPKALRVSDLIQPEKGLVSVIEADGLDLTNRKFVLGALIQAVFRYGTHRGEGVFDQGGRGPGTFIIMEEAHELFGNPGGGEDRDAAATRVATYEALFRRSRQYGLKLVAAVQNPSDVPNAILGNVGTVVSFQLVTDEDKEVMGSLFNWIKGIGQNYRELRYLGEQATGHCIIRLKAKSHYLQAAPVHVATDPPDLPIVTDAQLAQLARSRGSW